MSYQKPGKTLVIVSWVFQVLVAGIFAMAAVPKLTGDPGSVAMFEYLGFGPGRFIVGIAEAVAVILLLVPRTILFGGILSSLVMLGAIGSHLTKLGVSIEPATIAGDDLQALEALQAIEGPQMFIMAVGAFLLSLGVVVLRGVVLKKPAPAAS